MNMDHKELSSARWRCVACMSAIHGMESIVRVVPMAFPLFEATWQIAIRVEPETGLVERHLLETIRRMGPIGPEKLAEMTGLDIPVLEKAIADLKLLGLPVRIKEGGWCLDGEADILHGHVERTHSYAFLSNGLTGDFLPLTQYAELRSGRVGEKDIKTLHLQAVNPLVSPGEGAMEETIARTEWSHEGLGVGLPAGFAGFKAKVPEKFRLGHVLAFGFEFADGSSEIVSAGESVFRLACPGGDAGQYLGEARPAPPPDFAGMKISGEGNLRKIKVSDDSLWDKTGIAAKADSPEGGLLGRMVWPGWTCDSDNSFHLLRPADGKTARRLAVLRGCSMLRNTYENIKSAEELAQAAERFAEETKRGVPGLKTIPSFTEVLEAARRSQDGDLVDFARRFLPVARKGLPESGREPAATFMKSRGKRFHKTLVDAIRGAKRSIRIATPVLDEDGIFEALEDATGRGVEICVATQLPDHRTHRVKTDPQFKDYNLPRRKLAKLGARVRDCDHTIHAKLAVVDGEWMFFTSANLNANSLGVGKTNALEAAVVFDDRLAAHTGEALFWEIWNHAQYEQVLHDTHISIRRRPPSGAMRLLACLRTARDAAFLLSTPENGLLARKMAEMVASARKDIRMATMSFYDLKEVPVLFSALAAALQRKVKIQVAVRPPEEMEFPPDQWPDPSTKELMQLGLAVVPVPHLHAKGLVADRTEVLMTSANFNPYSLGNGPTAHIELGLAGDTGTTCFSDFSDFVGELLEGGKPLPRSR